MNKDLNDYLKALYRRLQQKVDADKYRTAHLVKYGAPSSSRGYTVLEMLPELWGLPLCDLIMAYVHALNPSAIRISTGEVTTDSCPGRVTILVDENDKVTKIEQEVTVAYASGYDLQQCLRALKTGTQPRAFGGCIGDIKGLSRVDFT